MWDLKDTMRTLEIRPGAYAAKVVDAFEGISQTSGAEMTTVVFETEGPSRFRVWEHLVHGHPVSARRMMALVTAVGLVDRERVEPRELVGRKLRVVVAVERFQGLPQGRVKRFLPEQAEAPSPPATPTR